MSDMLAVDPNDPKGLEAASGRLPMVVGNSVARRALALALIATFFEAADTKPTTHEVDWRRTSWRSPSRDPREVERWVTGWGEVADG